MSDPVVAWTAPEAALMAALAQRALTASRDGAAAQHAVAGSAFQVAVLPVAEFFELALTIAADRATLALDVSALEGHAWREDWALAIDHRGEHHTLTANGPPVKLSRVGGQVIRAALRVRTRAAEGQLDGVPELVTLEDAAFHRYTSQSSAAPLAATTELPWMLPTQPEPAPWWQLDLGVTRYVVEFAFDLAPLPRGTRVCVYAFGAPRPSGAPWPGSLVREDVVGESTPRVVARDGVVARYLRVALVSPSGALVSLALRSFEARAALLFADTLLATMRRAFTLFSTRPLTLARADGGYRTLRTYGEVWCRAMAFARSLAARLERSGGPRVTFAVMTRNGEPWIVAELAALSRGWLVVALSPDDPDERLAAELSRAEPVCVLCEAQDVDRLRAFGRDRLRWIVVCDGRGAAAGCAGFEALVAEGRGLRRLSDAPRDDDAPYAVLFTSGSTGPPKGAVRTYRSFHAVIASYGLGHSPRHLSFQPLSHLSERMYLPALLAHGGCVAFSEGPAHLFDELRALEPTSVGAVPRVYEVLRARHERRLREALASRPAVPRALVEGEVWRETSAALGGRLMALSAGSAPVPPPLLEFLRRAFPDVWVSDGYGSTEVGTIAYDGRIAPHVDVKLAPRPEVAPPAPGTPERGEILVRSPHRIAGYLGDPAATAAAIDADGYFATGDLGERTPDGGVRVLGRLRNVVKLAQGEFLSVERVEVALSTAPVVDRLFVHVGHGASAFAALVLPDAAVLARMLGATDAALATLVAHPDAPGVVLAALRAAGRAAGLAQHELPRAVRLIDAPLSTTDGLLTPSGKVSRPALAARYGATLEALATARVVVPEAGGGGAVAEVLARALGRPAQGDDALADLATDSLAVAELLAALSEASGREVPVAWWFEVRTISELAARIAHGDASGVHALRAMAAEDLAHPAPESRAPRAGPPRHALLTGATGLLGSHLVANFTARGFAVTCIVRARDDDDAARRVRDVLAARRLHAVDGAWRAVAGDLAASDGGVDGVPDDIDLIVHAGAMVNWLAPYASLRGANVRGTHALVAWAAARGASFHDVSTISVAPPDGDESSCLPFDAALAATPYVLSKWIAEAHVADARARGLPAAIYRPAMIAPDTRTGLGNPDDFLCRYLRGCVELGLYLDRDDAVLDMTPVDYVAEGIAALVAAHPRGGATWHLANIEGSMTYAAVGRAMAAAGYAVAPARYEEFRAALMRARGGRLHALAAFFPERFTLAMGPWPCARTVRVLESLGVRRPAVDGRYIARAVGALHAGRVAG